MGSVEKKEKREEELFPDPSSGVNSTKEHKHKQSCPPPPILSPWTPCLTLRQQTITQTNMYTNTDLAVSYKML